MLKDALQQQCNRKVDTIQRKCLSVDIVESWNRYVKVRRRQQQRNGKNQTKCQRQHLPSEDVPAEIPAGLRVAHVRRQCSSVAVHVQTVQIEEVARVGVAIGHQQRSVLDHVQQVVPLLAVGQHVVLVGARISVGHSEGRWNRLLQIFDAQLVERGVDGIHLEGTVGFPGTTQGSLTGSVTQLETFTRWAALPDNADRAVYKSRLRRELLISWEK